MKWRQAEYYGKLGGILGFTRNGTTYYSRVENGHVVIYVCPRRGHMKRYETGQELPLGFVPPPKF